MTLGYDKILEAIKDLTDDECKEVMAFVLHLKNQQKQEVISDRHQRDK